MMVYKALTPRRALELAAPHSWPASVLPVLLGTLLTVQARGTFSPAVFLLTLAAAVLLQSAVNTLNDVRDFVRGTDTIENCANETDAAMLYGQLSPRTGFLLGLAYLVLAAACGVGIAVLTTWRVWYFGLAAALAIGLYAGLGFSDKPLGELLSGLSMGVVLPIAAYFTQCGRCDWESVYRFVPCMITIACIMLTNNTADVARDAATGRHTLAVRLGAKRAQKLLCALLLLALMCVMALVLWRFPSGWAVLPVMTAGALLAGRPLYLGPVGPDTRDRAMGAVVRAHDWIVGGYIAAVAISRICPPG